MVVAIVVQITKLKLTTESSHFDDVLIHFITSVHFLFPKILHYHFSDIVFQLYIVYLPVD